MVPIVLPSQRLKLSKIFGEFIFHGDQSYIARISVEPVGQLLTELIGIIENEPVAPVDD